MRVISGIVSGASRLARIKELSREATRRLKWFDYYYAHGQNTRLTCRHFDISPQTFYRWRRRYDPMHLETLEDRSHWTRRVKQPTYSVELVEAVLRLRGRYSRWGKDKLIIFLDKEGYQVSASTVGRILCYAKGRGILKEPIPNYLSARKRLRKRTYATRKPKHYQAKQAGDIVQLDTLDLRPLPGIVLKHFNTLDAVSKRDVISVHRQATAATASHLLDLLEARMPFPVKAIQVDGGSEFQAVFEEV